MAILLAQLGIPVPALDLLVKTGAHVYISVLTLVLVVVDIWLRISSDRALRRDVIHRVDARIAKAIAQHEQAGRGGVE